MLARKIESYLENWKNTPNHKPLVLKGCRQCGKTYSVRSFAENESNRNYRIGKCSYVYTEED